MIGLMPWSLARLVEVEDPVHVAVVGDADRRLAVGRGRGHDVVDPGRAVEHRVLGVHVEVGERVAHDALRLADVRSPHDPQPVDESHRCDSDMLTASDCAPACRATCAQAARPAHR